MAKPDDLIGVTLGGCLILEVIGSGGMGVIYKARQRSLDRIVALKVLAPRLADDVGFVGRFQREARAIARVNHPNILAVYDVGVDRDAHYMIMELVKGRSLAELQAEQGGSLPVDEAVDYIYQAAQGLEAAQAAGIIHRDIKPENLMLAEKKIVKVADFGLAKEANAGQTSTDAVMGTPAFMSPEQCDGKKVDGRSDIYSLGGSFYKLLTGRLPFEAETAMSMMYRHKHEALIPPRELRPEIPEEISDFVVKMMAKRRENRPQTMTDVLAALDRARRAAAPAAPAAASSGALPAAGNSFGGGSAAASTTGDTSALEIVLPTSPTDSSGEWSAPPAPPPPGEAVPPDASRSSRQVFPSSGSGRFGELTAGGPRSSTRLQPVPGTGPEKPGKDGWRHVARGDELIGRGDRAGALKSWRLALQAGGLDEATRRRVEEELLREIETRRQAGEMLLAKGALVEAGRELRLVLDLDPKNEEVRAALEELDTKLAAKRTLVNDIRTAIAGGKFEEAVKLWDDASNDLRDDALRAQIERLRNVIIPSLKLCEQAERDNEEGRIEEALETFREALEIDETCERARQGVREVEMKAQRIERLLKDGYQHMLEQNHQDALDCWRPILTLCPGHPQAVKSIVEACLAHMQERRSRGDAEGALAACEEAHAADPHNRAVAEQLEKLKVLCARERELLGRAAEAQGRGRLSEAVRLWREAGKVNPANKRITQAVDGLQRERRRRRLKTLGITAVVVILSAVGAQVGLEYAALWRARKAYAAKDYAAVTKVLQGRSFFVFRQEPEKLRQEAAENFRRQQAAAAEHRGHWKEAAALYALLGAREDEIRCRFRATMAEGEEFTAKRKWKQAQLVFNKALNLTDAVESGDTLKLKDEAENAVRFTDAVQSGLEHLENGRQVEALADFLIAADCRPVDPFVGEKLRELHYDGEKFKLAFERGTAALKAAGPGGLRDPKKLREATGAFQAALAHKIGDKRSRILLRYLADLESCLKSGMVLYVVPDRSPLEPLVEWNDEDRRAAFCIDRYEYPNRSGVVPRSNTTWLQARAFCRQRGKRLCKRNEWSNACRGTDLANRWPYGLRQQASFCNTGSNKAAPAGSFSKCVNALGLYDMSGNVAEWLADDGKGENGLLAGGAYDSGAADADCDALLSRPRNSPPGPRAGFRCCRDLR